MRPLKTLSDKYPFRYALPHPGLRSRIEQKQSIQKRLFYRPKSHRSLNSTSGTPINDGRGFGSDPFWILNNECVLEALADAIVLRSTILAIIGAVRFSQRLGLHGAVSSLRGAVDGDDVGGEEILYTSVS